MTATPAPHERVLAAWLPADPLSEVQTLPEVIHRRAALAPRQEALRYEDQATSYAELSASIRQAALALRARGIGPGDRVILVMSNSAEFFSVLYGIQQLRAVAVPLYHVPQPERIARIARHCGAALIVTLRPLAAPVLRRLLAALGPDAPPTADAASLLSAPVDGTVVLAEGEADDLAMLQYTSGTTGEAKGVMLTHRALLANVRQTIPHCRFRPEDVFVSWLPVYHDLGLITMTMCPLYLGARLVLLSVALDPTAWLDAIRDHRGTITAAPDFAYRFVLRTCGETSRFDLRSLRLALIAAEPVRALTVHRFERAFGLRRVLRPGYGLAEASVGVTFYAYEDGDIAVDAAGMVCAGAPMAGITLDIRHPEGGRSLPPGRVGEICLQSPAQTLGYFRQPDATDGLFTADGFVRTGDLGYLDPRGRLYIVDRLKNIIKVAGRTLSPRELEEAADAVPGVTLSMALGVDRGGDLGEQVHLVVECGSPPPEEAARIVREVRAVVKEQSGLRPEKVHLVPAGAIPRTYNGKLQYAQMRARLTTPVPEQGSTPA